MRHERQVTNRDTRFRQGYMMGLRVAYLVLFRNQKNLKQAFRDLISYHDEYAKADGLPTIFEVPGMEQHKEPKRVKCNCVCHKPGRQVKHVVACCVGGYKYVGSR